MKQCQNIKCIEYNKYYKYNCLLFNDKVGSCQLYTPEKHQSAWELFRELFDKLNMELADKIPEDCQNMYTNSMSLVRFILLNEEPEATKILLKIKQEIE